MNSVFKSCLYMIPLVLGVALTIIRATQDSNIVIAMNYAVYTIVYIISLVILLSLLGMIVLATYKAFLTFFNLKYFKKK